ncbi:hypothetical protein BDK51DRAFT_41430 [Blyttiomyces helicus]|uniref:Uncharacterized protein n=1 Tax=Blyttiomyces helicus TaxID=388810 RepID=A0A4P9WE37_9FUNG|nr:hypothetical protein BDK51DRAFT_41430 [Blyttiomyces helicus]|eukprot:RKO90844.1 hypothetical protein BDK51DRAFT_41430 [Blyttiomyces helicus]
MELACLDQQFVDITTRRIRAMAIEEEDDLLTRLGELLFCGLLAGLSNPSEEVGLSPRPTGVGHRERREPFAAVLVDESQYVDLAETAYFVQGVCRAALQPVRSAVPNSSANGQAAAIGFVAARARPTLQGAVHRVHRTAFGPVLVKKLHGLKLPFGGRHIHRFCCAALRAYLVKKAQDVEVPTSSGPLALRPVLVKSEVSAPPRGARCQRWSLALGSYSPRSGYREESAQYPRAREKRPIPLRASAGPGSFVDCFGGELTRIIVDDLDDGELAFLGGKAGDHVRHALPLGTGNAERLDGVDGDAFGMEEAHERNTIFLRREDEGVAGGHASLPEGRTSSECRRGSRPSNRQHQRHEGCGGIGTPGYALVAIFTVRQSPQPARNELATTRAWDAPICSKDTSPPSGPPDCRRSRRGSRRQSLRGARSTTAKRAVPAPPYRAPAEGLPESADSRTFLPKPNRCSDIRAADLLVTSDMIRKFMDCIHASKTRTIRAATVRTLELRVADWRVLEDFASVIPELRRLRAFTAGDEDDMGDMIGPSVAVIASLLSSCLRLEVLDMPTSFFTTQTLNLDAERGVDGDLALAMSQGLDFAAVARGVRRLKCFRLSIEPCPPEEVRFRNLLIRSEGAPLVELRLECHVLAPSLITIRPPLRRVALGDEICDSHYLLPALLLACPSITDLDLSSARQITDATLAQPHDHPPLTHLRLNNTSVDWDETREYTLNGLQHYVRVRGSNLRLLDVSDNSFTTDDLLACAACLAQTTPLLEILGLRKPRLRPAPAPSLSDVAFLADLKRGCRNLRNVELGFSMTRAQMAEQTRQFLAEIKVDILENVLVPPPVIPLDVCYSLTLILVFVHPVSLLSLLSSPALPSSPQPLLPRSHPRHLL